jgi:uncharacterized RDD family membrane protein YckC
MTTTTTDSAVYYDNHDYVSVWRRLAIDLVDVCVAAVLSLAASAVLSLFIENRDPVALGVLTAWIGVWFSYFVLLKRSRYRTVGYILAKSRIVSLQGSTPSVASLTLRLMFAVLGPLNLLFDLFWIPSDPCRQALRDKFAHTYVVRQDASPAGSGRICYVPYSILGASYIFQEVTVEQPRSAA